MNEHQHHREGDEFKITELCEEHFLPRKDLVKIVWSIGALFVGALSAAVTYGLTNNTNIATLQTTVSVQKDQITDLQGRFMMIDGKLDKILLKITK